MCCIKAISSAISSAQSVVYEGVDTTKRIFEKNFDCKVEDVALKVYQVFMFILVAISAALLYLSNSTFFMIGAISSFFNKKSLDEATLKIQNVWLAQNFCRQACIVFVCALAWPISLSITSFMMGAYITSSLQDEAFPEEVQEEGEAPQDPPEGKAAVERSEGEDLNASMVGMTGGNYASPSKA